MILLKLDQFCSMLRLALLCASLAIAPAAGLAASGDDGADLPRELRAALKRHGLDRRHVGLYVHRVNEREPLAAYGADAARNPASTIKILTTLAALERLGPAFTWQTEVYAGAPVREGVLDGDLYIKGYGDPYLVIEHFWRLLRELRATGLQTIKGDLVLDQSHFIDEPGDPGEFDGQPFRAYNVMPRALMVNFQAVRFRFIPTAEGLRVAADPKPDGVEIQNRVKLKSNACRGWASRLGMNIATRAEATTVTFSGRYDAGCGEREMYRAIVPAPAHIYGSFRSLWRELGGTIAGGVREAAVPAEAARLASVESPPLGQVVRSINKFSNNAMTRQLLMTLGAEASKPPGSTEKGIAAVRTWLEVRGLKFNELVLENGSGLSRNERISARHMGELLIAAYRSAVMPEFMSSLPIASIDGTLKRRFDGALKGRMHLKTGRLDDVRALAGYVLDAQDRRAAVVLIQNHGRVHGAAGEGLEEAVLEWVYRAD